MEGRPSPDPISMKLDRIAALAKQMPDTAFTTLAHHIDVEWLRAAYRRTRKDGAPGVDGQSAEQYEQELESNLQQLLDLAKSGLYRAPPVRRVHIPKGEGRTRPIGIPTLEDKILQRAVTMLLEPIYEHDFLGCSFGFRPGRSAHQALKTLRDTMMEMHGGWVLEVDIEKFFDTLDHEHLRRFIEQRVRDGVVLRLIGKWLNAGVLEDGQLQRPEDGTPQGGVISPLLANIYLHEVLDAWFERTVKPRLHGRAELVRYADDFVIVFAQEHDARRVWSVLEQRMSKYGLKLHPEKTRLVEFGRPPKRWQGPKPRDRSFDFLGFTHHWARSRKGYWVIKQRTIAARFARAIQRISLWCRTHRHWKVIEQWKVLCRKLLGHFAYYDIIGNEGAIRRFRNVVYRLWRGWLNRRSQRARMSWKKMKLLVQRYDLPRPARRST